MYCLRQVGRFAYKHIRLMSRLLSLQPCCPHDEYTLISRSVRLISILLLINPGYFFIAVAPAPRCPWSFFNIFAVIHSWPAAMSAICIEHVCERITLLSFALYYPVRSYVRICVHISTVLSSLSACRAVLSIVSKGVYKHPSVKRIATGSLCNN